MVALTPEGVLYGNPPRSAHAPERDDFLAWMRATESLAGSGSLTSFNETLAVLQARPAVAEGKFALVISDADEAGVYERIAGDWQKVAGLPAIFTESLAAVRAEAARDLAQAYAAAANASRQEAAEIVGFDPTLYLLKTGGTLTGNLSVGGMASANKILAGAGSGSVGLTINDGHGNSNLTFNHQGGVPDNDSPTQSAARISADTDSDTANLKFMLADATTKGQNVGPTNVLNLTLSSIRLFCDTVVEGSLSADRAAGYWIATNSEARAGTNNDKIMTPLRTAECIAANQAVRAWVNFNGTGTPTIRASHNVTSITDNGAGDYTVNFATNMPHSNYAPLITHQETISGRGFTRLVSRTASAYRFVTTAGDGNPIDVPNISVAFLA